MLLILIFNGDIMTSPVSGSSTSQPNKTVEKLKMSLQLLDLAVCRKYFKLPEKSKLDEIITHIVTRVNGNISDENEKLTDQHPKNKIDLLYNYQVKIYRKLSTGTSQQGRTVDNAKNRKEKDYTITTRLFFFYRYKPQEEIVVGSMQQGWKLVRAYINSAYPIKIAERILDSKKILEVTRTSLVGECAGETLETPSQEKIFGLDSIYHMIERIEGSLSRNSSFYCLKEIFPDAVDKKSTDKKDDNTKSKKTDNSEKKKRKIVNIHLTQALVNVHKALSLQQISAVTDLFSKYVRGQETLTVDGKIETINQEFQRLNFWHDQDSEKAKELDEALLKRIFKKVTQKQSVATISFRSKYRSDYFSSTSFSIQIPKKPEKKLEDIPTFENVLEALKTIDKSILEKEEDFIKAFKKGALHYEKQERPPKLIDCLFTEYTDEANKTYFKFGKSWYVIKLDYHAYVQEYFIKLLKRSLLKSNEEGHLPEPWVGNAPKAEVTVIGINKIIEKEKGITKILDDLCNKEFAYVKSKSNDFEITEKILVGEILDNAVVKKHAKSIEEKILQLGKWPQSAEWMALFQTEADEIQQELKKKRAIFEKKNNSYLVINPFIHAFQDKVKLSVEKRSKLEQYLILKNKIKDVDKGESEEEYNRRYLGDHYGYKKNYLVFDQVTPRGIEPCDVLWAYKKVLHLYHIKEKFGSATRDACSQIHNAAELFYSVKLRQSSDYIKELWDEGIKTLKDDGAKTDKKKKYRKFRAQLKSQLITYGEKRFLEMFHQYKMVFVYAFLDHNIQKESEISIKITSSDLENRSRSKDNAEKLYAELQKDEFIDAQGRLTAKFYKRENFKRSEALYEELSKYASKSQSTIAKLELIRLEMELRKFGFDFKMCEISRGITLNPSITTFSVESEKELKEKEELFSKMRKELLALKVESLEELKKWKTLCDQCNNQQNDLEIDLKDKVEGIADAKEKLDAETKLIEIKKKIIGKTEAESVLAHFQELFEKEMISKVKKNKTDFVKFYQYKRVFSSFVEEHLANETNAKHQALVKIFSTLSFPLAGKGLPNLGNTCWLNAALQSISKYPFNAPLIIIPQESDAQYKERQEIAANGLKKNDGESTDQFNKRQEAQKQKLVRLGETDEEFNVRLKVQQLQRDFREAMIVGENVSEKLQGLYEYITSIDIFPPSLRENEVGHKDSAEFIEFLFGTIYHFTTSLTETKVPLNSASNLPVERDVQESRLWPVPIKMGMDFKQLFNLSTTQQTEETTGVYTRNLYFKEAPKVFITQLKRFHVEDSKHTKENQVKESQAKDLSTYFKTRMSLYSSTKMTKFMEEVTKLFNVTFSGELSQTVVDEEIKAFSEFTKTEVGKNLSQPTQKVKMAVQNLLGDPKEYLSHEGYVLKKITDPVGIPLELDLTGLEICKKLNKPPKYKLFALVSHHEWGNDISGENNRGHYTAQVLGSDGKWKNFDDTEVTDLDDKSLKTKSAQSYLQFWFLA